MTRGFASGVVLLAALCGALPWGVSSPSGAGGGSGSFLAIVVIFVVGFWHSDRLSYGLVFIAGLLADAAGGGPLGFWSLFYLLTLAAARTGSASVVEPGLMIGSAVYAMTAGVLILAIWAVTSLYRMEFVGFYPIAWPAAVSAIVFPLVARCLLAVLRWVDSRARRVAWRAGRRT